MSQNSRRELLDCLVELAEACPHLRLGQLVANLAMLAPGAHDGGVWDVEDDDLLTSARQHLENLMVEVASSTTDS